MLSRLSLVLAFLATLAPMAHVLEAANKLAIDDGALWLAIQQRLYRGWGPFVGAPSEIAALAVTLLLLTPRLRSGLARRPLIVAALAYVGMLAAFFLFNAPVNAAVGGWTAASLPADWPSYRARWETGHAIAAFCAMVGLAACLRANLRRADQ
ncbi:MAG TPA: hypothetical protein VHC42_10005 [Rhizomicrobium sp.]|nr:hypothetical protein [Rhizomicrobium sp.]